VIFHLNFIFVSFAKTMSTFLALSPLRRGGYQVVKGKLGNAFSRSPLLLGVCKTSESEFGLRMICLSSRIGRQFCSNNGRRVFERLPSSGISVCRQIMNETRNLFTSSLKRTKMEVKRKAGDSKAAVRPKPSKKEFKRLLGLAANEKWTLTGNLQID